MSKPVITIAGPVGSGKTTLMRIIATALTDAGLDVTCYDDGHRAYPETCRDVVADCPLHTSGVEIYTEN